MFYCIINVAIFKGWNMHLISIKYFNLFIVGICQPPTLSLNMFIIHLLIIQNGG